MPLQRVPLNNFRGGLNTRDGPFDLQPNESPDLLNVTLTALVGSLQMRTGKTRFDTNSPANTIDNCKQIVLGASTRFLMCSINGAIYSCDTTGAFVLRFTGTTGTVWTFEQLPDATGADRVWCSNGVDAPQKWDGAAASTSIWAGTPPKGTVLRVWRNKMVIAGVTATPQRLYLSKVGDPELTTGAYDTVDIRGPEDELAAITELNVLADRLYIFKPRSTWLMTDPTTFANRRIGEPGCTSRFQSDVIEEKLYFFNEQGLWSTAGVAVTLETGSITNYFPQHLNLAAINKVRVLGTRDSYPRILISLPIDGSAVNNIMIELVPHINFRRIGGRRYLLLPAFMLHSFDASSLAAFKPGANSEWGVFGGSASVNKLYQYFSGTTDDGVAITSKWQSSWMAIQGEEPFERVRRVNVELSGDVMVDVYKDFETFPSYSAQLPSTSTVVNNPQVDNVVPNSEFEGDPIGTVSNGFPNPAHWIPYGSGVSGTSTDFCSAANDWAANGRQSCHYFDSSASAAFTPTTFGMQMDAPFRGIDPTKEYSMVVALNVTSLPGPNPQIFMRVDWNDSSGTFLASTIVGGAVGQTGLYTLSQNNIVPPAGAAQALVMVYASLNPPGGALDFHFDSVFLGVNVSYRFARVRPESRGRFHSVRFRSVLGGQPFIINTAELAIRGGKEH